MGKDYRPERPQKPSDHELTSLVAMVGLICLMVLGGYGLLLILKALLNMLYPGLMD